MADFEITSKVVTTSGLVWLNSCLRLNIYNANMLTNKNILVYSTKLYVRQFRIENNGIRMLRIDHGVELVKSVEFL